MEIKHTIEILTKDIQDIEKLVGNLQNSRDGSAIELDLALSKLRNVYEILTMIKADRLHELLHPEMGSEPTIPQAKSIPEPEPVAQAEPVVAAEPAPEPEPVAEAEPVVATEPAPEPEPVAQAEPVIAAEPAPEPEPVAEAEPIVEPETVTATGTISEKFSADSSINENLGGQRDLDLDPKLIGQPIDQISRNIGINDRFLIIRELFSGNSDAFSKLISGLDGAQKYEAAMELLSDTFAGSMDHDGVEILSGLVKRKYLLS